MNQKALRRNHILSNLHQICNIPQKERHMDIGFRVEMPDDIRRMIDLLHSVFRGMVDVVEVNEFENLTISISADGSSRTVIEKGRYIYEKSTHTYNDTFLTSEAKVRRDKDA
jgi:hypothetical protein